MTNARDELIAAIRENMSPEGAALLASACHAAAGNVPNNAAGREVAWLGDEIITMIGPELYLALLDGAMDRDDDAPSATH